MDTITIKDQFNRPAPPLPFPMPPSNTIPVRFHVYWAGADKDGAVSGFYWAVVETLARPVPGQILVPELPGPKPQDYRFTNKTDSTFVFNVAEDVPDRQHAFYIYAVDNLGKPDATPARFIFNALDRFPPIPIIEECRCTGIVYSLAAGGGVIGAQDTTYVTGIDTVEGLAPRDTCAAGSKIFIRWRGQPQIPQTEVIGYRYKLDEPRFVEVGPEVTSVTYNSGIPPDTIPPPPGVKVFVLRAVDQAFGSRDSTRRFQLNYAPDTWWSGPDPNSPSLQTKPNGEKYATLVAGRLTAPIAGSLLGPDSTTVFPALRPDRKTFFEIWKDTVWVRQEGDTVHMNSWVLIHGGGFDRDSRYAVRVSDLARQLEGFPGGPVLDPGPANGSPIGFRSLVVMSLTPNSLRSGSSQTTLYPIFDPNDVFNKPVIGGYHPVFQAGRAFLTIQAEDADGDRDRRVQDGRALIVAIENGTATPAERELEDKVLVFYVDKAPTFQTDNPLFRPRVAPIDTFHTALWDLRLVANDEDPYQPNTPIGGPSNIVTLRRKLSVHGKDEQGNDVTYVEPRDYVNQQNIQFLVPSFLAGGICRLEVELCDCAQCEEFAGTGRCITRTFDVYYNKIAPAEPASLDTSRPGSDEYRGSGETP